MRSLGTLFLSALLSGVPDALRAAARGLRRRPVYVEVAPTDATLAEFVRELEALIDAEPFALVPRRADTPVVVEVHGMTTTHRPVGGRRQALRVTVRRGARTFPLLLDHVEDRPAEAARALFGSLRARPAS